MSELARFSPSCVHDFDRDTRGNLAYWDSVDRVIQLLEPAKPIRDPHVVIGKVGQQNLHPNHFTLKPKDLVPTVIADESGSMMYEPVPPGISAFLFWGTNNSKQDCLSELSKSCLGRQITEKNRLYITQVSDITEAGWTPYFVPLIERSYSICNPLHVILVPNSIINRHEMADATENEKICLASVFIRWDNYAV